MKFLIIFGFLLPSSIDAVLLPYALYPILNFILFIVLLIFSFKSINLTSTILSFVIITLFMINTFFSYLQEYQIGTLLTILPILLLLSVNIKIIDTQDIIKTLNILTFILFIFGIGMLFDIHLIQMLLKNSYTGTYADLYLYRIIDKSPVGPFGTHSIAAFIYFIFALIYYVYGLILKKYAYIFISFIYFMLIILLHSNSSLVFAVFYIFLVINTPFLLYKMSFQFLLYNLLIIIIGFFIINNSIDIISLLAGTNTNGLIARYGANGVLNNTILYLYDTNFLGDGLGYTQDLYYTDSGYIHSLLLYGVTGTVLFYIIFIKFIMKNFTVIEFFILSSFLFFEIGYDMLFYNRTVYLLILIAYFLNSLDKYTSSNDKRITL